MPHSLVAAVAASPRRSSHRISASQQSPHLRVAVVTASSRRRSRHTFTSQQSPHLHVAAATAFVAAGYRIRRSRPPHSSQQATACIAAGYRILCSRPPHALQQVTAFVASPRRGSRRRHKTRRPLVRTLSPLCSVITADLHILSQPHVHRHRPVHLVAAPRTSSQPCSPRCSPADIALTAHRTETQAY